MIMVIINSNNVTVNFKLYHHLGDMLGTDQGGEGYLVSSRHIPSSGDALLSFVTTTNSVVVEGDMGA